VEEKATFKRKTGHSCRIDGPGRQNLSKPEA
jgi:hypothetical protein